jgi:hypothetical protein
MINLNICLTDIPVKNIRLASNNKKYLDITVSELKTVDDKGNTHKVAVRQSKEERENKEAVVYLGRGKEIIFDKTPLPASHSDMNKQPDDNSGLPF